MSENFKQINYKEFKAELLEGDSILLDVRTLGELMQFGKISNDQILIDISLPNAAEKLLELDKSKKYLIYCWHGNRSVSVRDFMESNGFSYAKDLEGGIDVWNREESK